MINIHSITHCEARSTTHLASTRCVPDLSSQAEGRWRAAEEGPAAESSLWDRKKNKETTRSESDVQDGGT